MSFSFSLYVSEARKENSPRTGSVDMTIRRINNIDVCVRITRQTFNCHLTVKSAR